MAQWEFGGEKFGHLDDCSGPEGHMGDCIPVGALQALTGLVRNPAGYNEDSFGIPQDTGLTGVRCGNHPRDLGWIVKHENAAAVRACYAVSTDLQEQQRAEIYAEAGMSWVAGGGNADDARIYASVIASGQTWADYLAGDYAKHGDPA